MSDLISSNLDPDLKNAWRTDPDVFNAMNAEFNFSMDAAASHKNTLVPDCYLTAEDNALVQDWGSVMRDNSSNNLNTWLNPPYGGSVMNNDKWTITQAVLFCAAITLCLVVVSISIWS